ncbi:MAG TPA: hypothetical protein VLG11_04730 [Candidatus Saccharimonadales bacterium]|nr:hypothetical protein [Candidatus Saccharimonadales bacterium]
MTRLPQPGGDEGNWGDVLNEFLLIEHNNDGTLRADGSLSTKYTLPIGGIPRADLDPSVRSSLARADNPITTLGALQDVSAASPSDGQVLTFSSGQWVAATSFTPTIPVTSVNGQIGGVVITKTDVGLNNVTNNLQLAAANNLTDLTSPAAARTNLGLGSLATLSVVPLSSSVSGILPVANGGTGSATQNFVDLTTAQTIAGTKNFNGNIAVGSTYNLAVYKTADQTTNYERGTLAWSGNVLTLSTSAGGTGANRQITVSANSQSIDVGGTSSNKINLNFTTGTAGGTGVQAGGSLTGSSGAQVGLAVAPSIVQSGSSSYTALLVNPAETTVGTGNKTLLDLQIGNNSKFKVDSGGNATLADGGNLTIGTSAGTRIGTASTQKLGFFNATPVVQQAVSGSRSSGAALTALLTALANLGLIANNTTA